MPNRKFYLGNWRAVAINSISFPKSGGNSVCLVLLYVWKVEKTGSSQLQPVDKPRARLYTRNPQIKFAETHLYNWVHVEDAMWELYVGVVCKNAIQNIPGYRVWICSTQSSVKRP